MKVTHDLSTLSWTLAGWTPYLWRLLRTLELGESPQAELRGIRAVVPGSVQQALRNANLLPDWKLPGNDHLCEWVENRHWAFETMLPDDWFASGGTRRLRCDGLDYSGWVLLNGKDVGTFCGTHVPHVFDLTPFAEPTGNRLQIVFDLPPRWLGQFGYTSQIRDWKPRFNYLWDWTHRLVQTAIWEQIVLEVADGAEIIDLHCVADADLRNNTGLLQVRGNVSGDAAARVNVSLARGDAVVREAIVSTEELAAGVNWQDLAVDLWWPNGQGAQPVYTVTVTVLGSDGSVQDRQTRKVGFRNIVWRPCEGAPAGADPWLCVVNGRPVFLQGVDWLPLAPNFADVPDATYRHRVSLYHELGANTLRVWGGSYLEKEVFYDLCDEHGLLVWQDLMLSSSGIENLPPSDPVSISEMGAILRSFIARRQHHASLLLWCGGNELHEQVEGYGQPMTVAHPLLAHLDAIVRECDPGRRFIPTTATGPRFYAHPQDLGKGLLGNVHGPWKLWGTMAEWKEYWQKDDALFRAETGAPGAAPADIIRQYAGDFEPFPVSENSPVWRRPLTWWIEVDAFKAEHGRDPQNLEEYVAWSQARQAEALVAAVQSSKARFPRIGGILLWCGHDCYPCPANTSIIDFHGNPKPAALALKAVWSGTGGTAD
ncbi:MAG: glycosyl hydrolase 2 galactose-binding domain-containing protein [Kiritimatiellia bacterium]